MKTIKLTRGKETVVDDDDFERFSCFKWHALDNGNYPIAVRRVYPSPCGRSSGKLVSLSRLIMNANPGQIVDHIDGNTLNNQKGNLRFADRSQNGCNSKPKKTNTSGYKGVSKNAAGKWIAQLTVRRTFHWIGSYTTKKEAAAAYDAAALIFHGEFAKTNKDLKLL